MRLSMRTHQPVIITTTTTTTKNNNENNNKCSIHHSRGAKWREKKQKKGRENKQAKKSLNSQPVYRETHNKAYRVPSYLLRQQEKEKTRERERVWVWVWVHCAVKCTYIHTHTLSGTNTQWHSWSPVVKGWRNAEQITCPVSCWLGLTCCACRHLLRLRKLS